MPATEEVGKVDMDMDVKEAGMAKAVVLMDVATVAQAVENPEVMEGSIVKGSVIEGGIVGGTPRGDHTEGLSWQVEQCNMSVSR